jgi:hypothetical protein
MVGCWLVGLVDGPSQYVKGGMSMSLNVANKKREREMEWNNRCTLDDE